VSFVDDVVFQEREGREFGEGGEGVEVGEVLEPVVDENERLHET